MRALPLPVALVLAACASPPLPEPPLPTATSASPSAEAPPPLPTAPPTAAPVVSSPPPPPADPAPPLRERYRVRIATRGGAAVLEAEVPCEKGRCARPPVKLGLGRVGSVGVVDLLGGPTSLGRSAGALDFDAPASRGLPDSLPGEALFPAAVLRVQTGAGAVSETRLVLVSLQEDPPTQILSVVLASSYADGGGVSTINDVRLEGGLGGPLDVVFSQTAMPRRGDKVYRPGPPLARRYRFDGKRYQLER